MSTSSQGFNQIQRSNAPLPSRVESKSPNRGECLLVALGIIVFIGSLVATGFLISHLGYASFAIGGVGLICGGGCILFGLYGMRERHNQANDGTFRDAYQMRAKVFRETLGACKRGYVHENTHINIDNTQMLQGTETYSQPEELGIGAQKYRTKFSVVIDDTLNVLIQLRQGGADPVGLNMAGRCPGGGVVQGCPAQEEALCRRSNHILGLQTQPYPIPEEGGIYCPHVYVFREDEAHHFAFMKEPQEVALVAAAAFDLRFGSTDRSTFDLPLMGSDEKVLNNCEAYKTKTKSKIRNMLRIMSLGTRSTVKGHTHIVLGAFGCGAFENPPVLMSNLFFKVFSEPEFQGRFEQVIFAILKIFPKDQCNVDAFTKICSELNKD